MAEFLAEKSREKFATNRGTEIHKQLQFLQLDNNNPIAEKIRSNPQLIQFWEPNSRAEVPIAGFVGGKFYSKRIDRLVKLPSPAIGMSAAQNSANITSMEGNLLFLDYKTDTTRERRLDYEKTMKIYASLLSGAYPNHCVSGFILWLHDWELEKIC